MSGRRVWGAELGGVARVRVFSKKLFGCGGAFCGGVMGRGTKTGPAEDAGMADGLRRGVFGPGSGGKAEGLGWVDGEGADPQRGPMGGRAIEPVRRRGVSSAGSGRRLGQGWGEWRGGWRGALGIRVAETSSLLYTIGIQRTIRAIGDRRWGRRAGGPLVQAIARTVRRWPDGQRDRGCPVTTQWMLMTAMVKGDWSSMSDATVAGLRARPLTLSGHRHARGAPRGHGRVRSAERAAYRPTAVPAPSLVATVSQRLVVEAVPELAPGSRAPRPRPRPSPAPRPSRSAARAGTPGLVPSIIFPFRAHNSVRVAWGTPSDGDEALTGFGLLLWRTQDTQPAYSSALVKGAGDRGHTYTGLQADTTLQVPDPRLQRRRQLRLVDRAAQGGADPDAAAGADADAHGHGGAGGPPRPAAYAQLR